MRENDVSVPPGLEDIAPYVKEWGLSTFEARVRKRVDSSIEELSAFHSAMLPHLERIIEFLNRWPLDEIPEEYHPLGCAVLTMCEIDNPVTRWKAPVLRHAQDPRSILFKGDFYDVDSEARFEEPTFSGKAGRRK